MRSIRKGDEVIVLTGKDKGQKGTVARVIPEKDRVIVDGVNMVKKHTKPNPNLGIAGGIVEKEMSSAPQTCLSTSRLEGASPTR